MKEHNFPSQYNIGDEVDFIPMLHQCERIMIEEDVYRGHIVSARFTKAKVFYSIVDDYHGIVFEDVDSAKVGEEDELRKQLAADLNQN